MDDAGHDENPLGLREGTLRLMPYRSEWPILFRREAARITDAAALDSLVELHHIGSTAVEGLAAKPILDIALVAKPETEWKIADILAALGYVERGERSGRHFILYVSEGVRIHNLHLYMPGDERLRKQIAFRDVLRRDPKARAEYTKLKASLINGARQDYAPAKTDFITSYMAPLTPSRVRVILLSPKGRILLIRYRNTGPSGVDRPCWTTAGGGMEAGETISDTALRELQEETGISDVSLGPVIWYGEDSERGSDWGVTFKEHFIVAHSKNEDVRKDGWTEHEHQQILEMRWWSIQEISESCDLIYPNGLDELLTPILAGEYPTELKIISAPLLLNPQSQTHTPSRQVHNLRIRPLRPGDAAAIESLYSACMRTEPGIGPVTQAQWSTTIALPQFGGGRDFLVADHDETVVGLAESSLRDQGTQWVRHLKLVVDPAWRRKGVGTKLLHEVLAQGPENTAVLVQCNVPSAWTAGLAFAARFGLSQIEAEIFMHRAPLVSSIPAPAGILISKISEPASICADLASLYNEAFRGDVSMHIATVESMRKQCQSVEVWIATSGNEVVGFAFVEPEESVRWLEALAVAPWCQRSGIGAALVVVALRGEGAGENIPAGLSVSSRNPSALRLYERLGFVRRSEKAKFAATRDSIIVLLRNS